MTGHNHLASSQLPDVKVVDILSTFGGLKISQEIVEVDVIWHSLHNDVHALLDNRGCGEEHDNREHEGADWIDDLPLWLPENDTSSDDDSNGLDKITNDMDLSSPLVEIFGFGFFRIFFFDLFFVTVSTMT